MQIANCQIYVVKTTDFENFKRTGHRGGNANIRFLTAERRMQEITAQTGGTVYSPIDENELDAAFNHISAELSQQYILSYYPEDEADKRGEFRAISLAVKNRQDLIRPHAERLLRSEQSNRKLVNRESQIVNSFKIWLDYSRFPIHDLQQYA